MSLRGLLMHLARPGSPHSRTEVSRYLLEVRWHTLRLIEILLPLLICLPITNSQSIRSKRLLAGTDLSPMVCTEMPRYVLEFIFALAATDFLSSTANNRSLPTSLQASIPSSIPYCNRLPFGLL